MTKHTKLVVSEVDSSNNPGFLKVVCLRELPAAQPARHDNEHQRRTRQD